MTDARPYFSFETELTPVPATPTECRTCGVVLERMRRTGGLCAACVRAGARPSLPPTEALETLMTLVRSFHRQRPGHRERFAEARCSCGRRRVMQWSTWVRHRPHSCNKCRLRSIERGGFEAEYQR
jgi:hypothetical protein